MARLTKKKYLVVGTSVAVLATGGIAFAYWTSTGSGTGTATAGTSSAWAVTVDSVNLSDLTPGGPTDTITFHVKNNNSGVQNLGAATPSVTGTSDPGCTAADFNVSAATITTGDVASGATVDGTFTVQMKNTSANQDLCKGVSVNLKVAAS